MFTYALIFLVILVLLLLWGMGRKPDDTPPPAPGPGTVIRLPDFKPIPRRPPVITEPNPVPVVIGVIRDANGVPVDLTIPEITLGVNDQAAWSGGANRDVSAGKLEIRVSPDVTPFGATAFTVARGGTVKSGAPVKGSPNASRLDYTVLLTTPDGFLLRKSASLNLRREGPPSSADRRWQTPAQEGPGDGPQFGTVIRLPEFERIERRPKVVDEPPTKEVRIAVARDQNGNPTGVIVKPENQPLNPDEQIAWTTGPRIEREGGKIEIRFAPNGAPFGGTSFITARGGVVKSGRPAVRGATRGYIVLLTTDDGRLLSADASVTIA
ncbi:MAG: hypothetical protein ACKVX9_04810 [Blastocatellia bacterium]